MNPPVAPRPPNILFLMVDQLTTQALPFHGHPVVQAPHMAQLAAGGVVWLPPPAPLPVPPPPTLALPSPCPTENAREPQVGGRSLSRAGQ